MIEYLVIMKQNGQLLYSKSLQKLNIEEEILLGFFAATANFSREALQTMVEDVNLGSGKRVIMVPAPQEKLIAAAITTVDDNRDLVKFLLNELLGSFISKFGPHFSNINGKTVETDLNLLLKKRIAKFSFKTILKSWIVQFVLGIIMSIVGLILANIAKSFISGGNLTPANLFVFFLIGTVLVLIVYPLPMFVTGYILGNARWAKINIILYLILTFIAFSTTAEIAIVISGYLLVIIVLSIVFTNLGINFVSKRKLKA